jgi:uncharacterized membrane protein YiaA
MKPEVQKPTSAFVAASWIALGAGIATYAVGVWAAPMALNEKGYYLTLLLYGLFSAVSLQKAVRDRLEGIPVTAIYSKLCWVSLGFALFLLVVGLWNAELMPMEKGFFAMAYLLSLFAAVTVQKNIRDLVPFAE